MPKCRTDPGKSPPQHSPSDTRTEAEKEEIARDPSKTDETVVLPADNGAAVLDSDKDADNSGGQDVRQQRNELRAQEDVAPPPESDAAAQAVGRPDLRRGRAADAGRDLTHPTAFDLLESAHAPRL